MDDKSTFLDEIKKFSSIEATSRFFVADCGRNRCSWNIFESRLSPREQKSQFPFCVPYLKKKKLGGPMNFF